MKGNDEVVIGGIAGRFPKSENLLEFWDNLYNGVDMVTEISDRWNVEAFSMPTRMGHLKGLDKFDANFMVVLGNLAENMDPRMRIFLELTHEAIIDAGINPVTLRGTKTGVFLGLSGEENYQNLKRDSDSPSGYSAIGSVVPMHSNRVSFTFDFKGPSISMDTACSSSLLALQQALVAIRTGACDSAIVGGIHLCLDPKLTLAYTKLGMTSMEGKCRSFDVNGQGYVRSEAAVVLYVCKSQFAKRSYATVVQGKTNVDGFKSQGITFPSGAAQEQLLREVYEEAGVDPKDVEYVEAHGTGTKAGDTEEVNAIARVFCDGRDPQKPLLIGSVKSNMGHTEPASGLCQIAKVILAHQHGIIPGNLHYSEPNPDIPALLDGRINVVDKNTEFSGNLVGINSFGFGGANVHILLKLPPPIDETPWKPQIPFIVPFSGRTAEVQTSLEKLMDTRNGPLMALLQDIAKAEIPGHNFRSYGIFQDENENTVKLEVQNEEKRPVWFMFSGMGSQYTGMIKDMMKLTPFRLSVEKSTAILQNHGHDLNETLFSEDTTIFDDALNAMVAGTSIQVALNDLLNAVGVHPDGILGHSLGETACGYADGCLTAEQSLLVSLGRGKAFNLANIPGAMASIGLSWDEASIRCPQNVYPACHNAADNVTISGPQDLITQFTSKLKEEGVFAKEVQSSGFAFHSSYMNPSEPFMKDQLRNVIPNPMTRTPRWLSTSIPIELKNTDLEKYCSMDYFVNNALSPVRFYETLLLVPKNAVVIEIAPHNLMHGIVKRSLPDTVTSIGLMNRKASSNVRYFLDSVGQLYLSGYNPDFSVLYNQEVIPAAVIPLISPVIKWDHSESWLVPSCEKKGSKTGGDIIKIDLNNEDESFYSGHAIDGRILFPTAGYMWLVWTTFAKQRRKKCEEQSVVFENLRIERSTVLQPDGAVEFLVNVFKDSGDFEVFENDSAVFRGRIRELIKNDEVYPETVEPITDSKETCLNTEDFYKELRLRGYECSGVFKGIKKFGLTGKRAEVSWENNWVGFLDALLQISVIQHSHRGLYLTIRLQKATIEASKFLNFCKDNSSVPVKFVKELRTIKAPGVEFRGVKVSIAPRRPASSAPTISKQIFVPYFQETPLSFQHCLEFLVNIVLDNTQGKRFVLSEISNDSDDILCRNLVSNISTAFEIFSVFVITEAVKNAIPGVISIPPRDIKSVQNTNLAIISQVGSINLHDIISENGFVLLRNASDEINKDDFVFVGQKLHMRLYRRGNFPRQENMTALETSNTNFEWVEKLKSQICDALKLIIYSNGTNSFGLLGLLRCLLKEGYENIRCYIAEESYEFNFDSPSEDLQNQLEGDMVVNVHKAGCWGCYSNLSITTEELGMLRNVTHSFVNALHPGDLSTVLWIESPLLNEQKCNLCQVHYASLNFRDVMLATGKLSSDALPGDLAFQECVLGMEFSGELNGRHVFGLQAAKCLATGVKIDECGFLWEVPKKWSLAEAATIPVAYATAYYALVVRGQIRNGETVLIHVGSGGVGQAAIAIALSKNCKVITTVSTFEKRQFLKERFPELQDEYFTDSRNASVFEKHVMEVTNGKGVDIVLNSLAQDRLEASVRCLAKYGRFLEIGKFDLFNNSALGMEIFLRSINFEGVLLEDLIQSRSEETEEISRFIRVGIDSGLVRPLPHALFHNNQLEEAFRFMATGKHMGKVVISIAEGSPSNILSLPRTYFHSNKSYVLIGGLGGMGLEIANWMVSRGARNLVFVTRSGVTRGYQAYRVKIWEDQGVSVALDNSDVSTQSGAENALKMALKLGPIGGIFNLAVVLKDAVFLNQTVENFEIVSKAKILATIELDKASRALAPELDYFVCFSSIASSHGNAGQTNYGFANEFMERLCEKRREDGLPGLAIQWGSIEELVAHHDITDGTDILVCGVTPQKISSCFEMFDLFLQQTEPVLSSFIPISRDASKEVQTKTVVDLVAHVLGIKDATKINSTSTLLELGMDSLMASEIKNLLEIKKDLSLPVAAVGELTFTKLKELESNQLISADGTSSQPVEPLAMSHKTT